MKKTLSFTDVLNLTFIEQMKKNSRIISFGLGIDDPKNIFGTTKNLQKKFGLNRIFDTPTSENAMTGIGVGLSLDGFIPIMVHQRLDFFLLAMDQLVNSAAKWKYMFGGGNNVKMLIRLIIGRGWGQGPTHSQNLQTWFAHVPGLKVVSPTFPSDARKGIVNAINENGPVIFLEHRWLHSLKEKIDIGKKIKPSRIGKGRILKSGSDLTIISHSYSTIEILKIYKILNDNKIKFEHIDLVSLKPLDINLIKKSVSKTGKLLILDNSSTSFCSIGSEIISQLIRINKNIFKKEPNLLTLPDLPSPTSHYLSKEFYISSEKILASISKLLSKKIKFNKQILRKELHDIPNQEFKGPF
uniref:Acetoin dehydrogenase beta chain n=1 Tax=Pelagibacter ubique TaxID=198252 RepID=B1A0Q5_PELUQ|nr:acetoin dehydrogenase beta chain [Candidatus Pelagibacter ubique]